MAFASYADIETFLNQNGKIIQGSYSYGLIGISQKDQFAEISKNGIPLQGYNNLKTDLNHRYKVWTIASSQQGILVYDKLLRDFGEGLIESFLSSRNRLQSGEVYIYFL